MKILMWNAGARFSFMWVTLVSPLICEWDFNSLLMLSVPGFALTTDNKADSTFQLAQSSLIQTTFFRALIVAVNTVLSVDLICTLRTPFQDPSARYPFYIIYCILLSILPCWVRGSYLDKHVDHYGVVQQGLYYLEFFIAIISIIYAIWYLCRPGMGRGILLQIVYRHILYIVVNICC